MSSPQTSVHVPVLRREVIEALDLANRLLVVDGTVGGGGHSQKILEQIGTDGRLIGLDRDPMMLRFAEQLLSAENVELIQASYAELPALLAERNIETVDRVLLDLGLSSDQLADANRGFGFQIEAPLDLRFDTSRGVRAAELIANSSTEQLTQIISEFGEERHAARIAKQLTHHKPQTTTELVEVISAISGGGSEKHPATRTFQALRIAVNEELNHLRNALSDALPRSISAGGRLAVISFHSLEDRLVKHAFKNDPSWKTLTKKPIAPSPIEIRNNPRSRSAKLRAAERTAVPISAADCR